MREVLVLSGVSLVTVVVMQTTMDLQLRPDDRDTLKRSLRRPTTPSGQTRRAHILLALDAGRSATDTAKFLQVSRSTVHLWHRRYLAQGLAGLVDRARSGRPTLLEGRTVERILFLTTERVPREAPLEHPADGSLRRRHQWQVRQVWQAADVKPHRLNTFKLSQDPQFAEKGLVASRNLRNRCSVSACPTSHSHITSTCHVYACSAAKCS